MQDAIAAHLGSRQVARVLYGSMIGLALVVALEAHPPGAVDMFDEVGAVAFGIAFPCVFFLLAAVGAIDLDAAFTIAKWSGLGLIVAYGFAAARLTGDTVPRSLRRAGIAGVIAAFLILIKALLH